MPDTRRHRGPHPGDGERFAAAWLPQLRAAADDLGWLATRGYTGKAALQLVGDRHALDLRQRQAITRASCAPGVAGARRRRERPLGPFPSLWIDGFNVLTTIESALGGGVVLGCTDGCYRDLASLHGTWRRVDETAHAAELLGERLAAAGVAEVTLLLDAPVGNSGRLAALLRELASARGWPWRVEAVASPDRLLRDAAVPIATADSAILDTDVAWVNLARTIVAALPDVWIVDLAASTTS